MPCPLQLLSLSHKSSEQSTPPFPGLHKHLPMLQTPFPEQSFGQSNELVGKELDLNRKSGVKLATLQHHMAHQLT